jgi:hypothetical protein
MKFPKCNTEMVEGKTHLGGGPSTVFLLGGLSLRNLVFTAAKWKEHVVQDTPDVLPAHYCNNCGMITIETSRSGLSTLEGS